MRWSLPLVTLSILLVGCGSPKSTQATLGPTGGMVGGGDATITVPAGAVGGNTDFTVTQSPDAPTPSTATAVGTPYTLGPEGATFSQPVTVTLVVDTTKIPSGKTINDVAIYTAPAGSTSYTRMSTRVVDPSHVAADTMHFSTFVPAVSTLCQVTCGVGMSGSTSGGSSGGTSTDGGVDSGTTSTIACSCTAYCNADGTAATGCSTVNGGTTGGGSGTGGTSGGSTGGSTCTSTGTTYSVVCTSAGCTCNPTGTASALACSSATTPEAIFAAYQSCGFPGEYTVPSTTTGTGTTADGGTSSGSADGCSVPTNTCGAGCSITCTPPQTAQCTVAVSTGPGTCSGTNSCTCQ